MPEVDRAEPQRDRRAGAVGAPGPDASAPAPKNVPTTQAQAVFFPGSARDVHRRLVGPLALVLIGGALAARAQAFELVEQVGVVHGRRDDVAARGPLAEVKDAAAVGAEGEVLGCGEDDLAACR